MPINLRYLLPMLAALGFLLLPGAAGAQQQVRRVKVDELSGVQIGFRGNVSGEGYKAGLWTPILVTFYDDPEGKIRLPVGPDGAVSGELLIETADNDGIVAVYPRKFNIGPNEPMQVLTYAKVASSYAQIGISVQAGGKTFGGPSRHGQGLDFNQLVYMALGDNLLDLRESLLRMAPNQGNDVNTGFKSSAPRHAIYENDPQYLPDQWFGYNCIDLAILVTNNEKLVDKLLGNQQTSPQLQALAEWVRRGGRLVVSIAPTNRDKVYRLLSSPAWQPALPAVLTPDSKLLPLGDLEQLLSWSHTGGPLPKPLGSKLKKAEERNGVRLQENPAVAVACKAGEGADTAPLIVRFPHGLGSITLLAFDVKAPFLSEWDDRFLFWQALVKKLGPASLQDPQLQPGMQFRNQQHFGSGNDITSRLYDELEKFDTPTISFGWVVLFIFIYILVVGPVDYIILKLVFKRLELTWLTFPAVVITVSLLAYFTAYAIKGQDLKVNKIDLVDIDLRSGMREDLQPAAARAFGTTWFAILSPRIQNYTIGIEPVLHTWQSDVPAPKQPIEPTMSWLGRPEFGGFGAGGRGRSSGLFSRNYNYEPNAVALRGVPIPVWTTKSFTASWETPISKDKLPIECRLTYVPGQPDSITGTLQNNLPFDLREVGLVHRGQLYPLPDIAKGSVVNLKLDPLHRDLSAWAGQEPIGRTEFNPQGLLRRLMFHEKIERSLLERNNVQRSIDWSWLFDSQWSLNPDGGDARIIEVVLVARVGRSSGRIDELQSGADPKLPTYLWLGELPGQTTRPKMEGTMIQETYLRAILPVVPRKGQ